MFCHSISTKRTLRPYKAFASQRASLQEAKKRCLRLWLFILIETGMRVEGKKHSGYITQYTEVTICNIFMQNVERRPWMREILPSFSGICDACGWKPVLTVYRLSNVLM